MANLDATVYTAQTAAADNAASMIDTAELISGKVSFLQLSWTAPSGTANNDIVRLGYLPSGMTVVTGMSTIEIDTNGGANPPSLGIEGGSVTAITSGIDISAAGSFVLNSLVSSGSKTYTASEREVLTLALTGAVTTGMVIHLNLFLVNSN